ncbi:YicC family protein [bacterium]|nr:YicC family protein [candidate division CSSED10-310 bacterium]
MALSMTGTGESRLVRDGYDLNVFIRSVNHRFFQINIRLPKGYFNLESRIRDHIRMKLHRGKLDLHLDLLSIPREAQEVVINESLADRLIDIFKQTASRYDIPTGLTVDNLLRFPELVNLVPDQSREDMLWPVCHEALDMALEDLLAERAREGESLVRQIKILCRAVSGDLDRIRDLADSQVDTLREKLKLNIRKLGEDLEISENRLEQEVLLFSIRADISEEIIRLNSHLERFMNLIDSPGAVGKKCDFLLQEMHREINTIGSKYSDSNISELVVEIKTAVEKMKEQIQNIE